MKLLLSKKAIKELDKIPNPLAQKIYQDLIKLKEDPYPHGSKKLVGKNNYRIRIGTYRAVYSIDKGAKAVIILKVKHRREVYR